MPPSGSWLFDMSLRASALGGMLGMASEEKVARRLAAFRCSRRILRADVDRSLATKLNYQ